MNRLVPWVALLGVALLAACSADKRQPVALDGQTLKERVEHLEVALVRAALDRHRWNHTRAADELGLSRVGLSNKLKRYAIGRQDDHPSPLPLGPSGRGLG